MLWLKFLETDEQNIVQLWCPPKELRPYSIASKNKRKSLLSGHYGWLTYFIIILST